MNRTNANNTYRSLMNRIEMPNRVHDRIVNKTKQLRSEEAQTAQLESIAEPARSSQHLGEIAARPCPEQRRSSFPSAHSSLPRHRLIRTVAVGACTLALAGGIAFAAATGGGGGLETDTVQAASTPSNSFVLTAYADENPEGTPGKTVQFSLEDFGFESAWKVWNTDPEIGPNDVDSAASDGQRYLSVAFRFNLGCVGTNVASLTYTIEGDRVLFYTRTNSPGSKGEVDSVEERGTSFTVTYDEQRSDPTVTWRALRASFPLEGELANLYDAVTSSFYSGTADRGKEANDRLGSLSLRSYADAVAQSRLTITATFTDGTTQTKTYVIAPVDNLEETMEAYVAAVHAQAAAFDASNLPAELPESPPYPQLFTLTELA